MRIHESYDDLFSWLCMLRHVLACPLLTQHDPKSTEQGVLEGNALKFMVDGLLLFFIFDCLSATNIFY